IQGWWDKKVEDLSKGMQQKVQFAATVVHNPQLIILDEPFSGFDPVNAEMIKDEILELNRKGATIIFSTHRMESVEQLCNHIVLINKSRKILDGRISDIRNLYRSNTFSLIYKGTAENAFENPFPPFDLIKNEEAKEGFSQLIIKIKTGFTVNDALTYLIPHMEIREQ